MSCVSTYWFVIDTSLKYRNRTVDSVTLQAEGNLLWHFPILFKSKVNKRVRRHVDPVPPLLIPQTLDREIERQCPLTWTPASPVLTGCLSWESAACARGKREEEEEEGRGRRRKTEGGRGETSYPLCRTPPLQTLKGNLLTATPLSLPWQLQLHLRGS